MHNTKMQNVHKRLPKLRQLFTWIANNSCDGTDMFVVTTVRICLLSRRLGHVCCHDGTDMFVVTCPDDLSYKLLDKRIPRKWPRGSHRKKMK